MTTFRSPLSPWFTLTAIAGMGTLMCPALLAHPILSEIVAINTGEILDKDDDLSAWVEFYNPDSAPANLKGYYVTDDPDDPTKHLLPTLSVPAEGYALLFLSGKDFSSLFQAEVHTAFRFDDDDDYFALVAPDGVEILDAMEDATPDLGLSYGRPDPASDELSLFAKPTPRAANQSPLLGAVADTKFSVNRGFFSEAFEVEITTETEGARIIYTTDGREPSEGSLFTGPIRHVYDGPITISETTVLRAAAFKEGYAPSNIDTQTYLFLDDVITQEDMRTSITESAQYGPLMHEALTAIPTISLAVDDRDDVTIGGDRGNDNDEEFATSVEWMDPTGEEEGFQVNAGVARYGGYFTNFAKESFRLHFRKRYGAAKLRYPVYRGHEHGIAPAEEFNSINLRSGSHDMNARGAYLSNRFIDDTLLEMGHIAPHGRFVHVYFNGAYWGQYHLRERWDAEMFASYFGGEPEDYDAINGNNTGSEFLPGDAFDGTDEFWDEARAIATEPLPFGKILNHVDMGSYLAFQLTWMSGNSESEFQAGGSRTLGVPFKFYFKDADGYLRPPGNRLTNRGPGDIFREMQQANDPDFDMFLADTIHKHYFADGMFTPEKNIARLQNRVDETKLSFIAESARWNFHTPSRWQSYQDGVTNRFENLTKDMVRLFKSRGWYPDVTAPIFIPQAGEVEPGASFVMNAGTLFNPQPGTIYFTLDGTDPRLPGGDVAGGALTYDRSGPGLSLEATTHIKARLLDTSGEWSALVEGSYHIGKKPEPGDLVVSELHYRPTAPSPAEVEAGFTTRGAFEFVELYNRSDSTLNLEDVLFTDGIRFDFADADAALIAPGERILLVANPEAFASRHGSDLAIAGHYQDTQLSNGGETLLLTQRDGAVLLEFTYDDESPWPEEADGAGRSLTLKDPDNTTDYNSPESWQASAEDGGSPGRPEGDAGGVDLAADEDGDGLPVFAEVALGTSDNDPHSGRDRLSVERTPDGALIVTLRKSPDADRSQFQLETSQDLEAWSPSQAAPESNDDDPARLQWNLDANSNASHLRIEIKP